MTGTVTPNDLAISGGLQGDERVVLFAGGFLNPGETVKVNVMKATTAALGRAGMTDGAGPTRQQPVIDDQSGRRAMNFRNISAWCIRNPVAPIVLFIGLTLAGMLSFSKMAVVNDPPTSNSRRSPS